MTTSNETSSERATKRNKSSNTLTDEIAQAWSNVAVDTDVDKALEKTLTIWNGQIEDLIKTGLDAFHTNENHSSALTHLKDELAQKDVELEALKASAKNHADTVSNLLKALEKSRMEAGSSADAAVQLANMRSENAKLTKERDQFKLDNSKIQSELGLVKDELHLNQKKYHTLLAEKTKVDRDYAASQRATMSLGKSAALRNTADAEYHKRKIAELQSRIQSLQAVVSEKNRQLEDYRRHSSKSTLGSNGVSSRKRSL